MPTPRRASRRPHLPRPAVPTAPTLRYLMALRGVTLAAETVAMAGLRPLLALWPREDEVRQDAPSRRTPDRPSAHRPRGVTRGPLSPPIHRDIRSMTDDELRRLWPSTDPADVRRYAPWATSREEVYRIAYPAGTDIRTGTPALWDCEPKVQAAIRVERAMVREMPAAPTPRIAPPRRPPWAFRIARPIFGADGNILVPPLPTVLSSQTIRRQMEWIDLATHEVVTSRNLLPIIDEAGRQSATFATRQMERVMSISLRREAPELQPVINHFRELNINLIESGIMRGAAAPRMRPSMLADLSQMVEQAHAQGLRVEALAGRIAHTFGVSDKRAELIARDQTLKLNAQIARARQQAVGVTHYEWSSSNDERTRTMHRELGERAARGEVQAWASPPEVAPGRFEHPGGDYQCRCQAIPIPPRDGGEFDYGL